MISIKEIAEFYFKKFDDTLSKREKEKVLKFLSGYENKKLKKLPYGLKNPVFEILTGIRGSGKTFKISSNIERYKNYLVIDPDVFRKDFPESGKHIPSVIKDILVFYGISNGMNVILQSGKWSEKRELFLYASKHRKDFFNNMCYNGSEYTNKITILSTNPSISAFSAYYRYYIEKQNFYIPPENDNYMEEGIKSIHDLLVKIKNKTHIKPYVTKNRHCFEIKGTPLYETIDRINFIDRYSFIKSFIPVKDKKEIREMFPSFFKATMYREIHIESIYEEYKKITKAINYCQKNKNRDFLNRSLLYFSYLGYSISNYISEFDKLTEKESREFVRHLEKIKKDANFKVFEKVKVRDTNVKELIENFLKEKYEVKTIKKNVQKD